MSKPVRFDNLEVAFKSKNNHELTFSAIIFKLMSIKVITDMLIGLTKLALFLKLPISFAIKATIFRQFCGGESINESLLNAEKLGKSNIGSILDYSIEGENSEVHFEHTKNELLKIIKIAKTNKDIPVTCLKLTGIGRFNTYAIASSKKSLDQKTKSDLQKITDRLDLICEACVENDTPIYIDAEESWIQPIIDQLTEEMMKKYNKSKAIVFNTLQMYRWDRIEYLEQLIENAKADKYFLGLKIVRGAYLERENKRAKEMNYKSPMQTSKDATDKDYDLAIRKIIDSIDIVELCAGTHNEKSAIDLTILMNKKGLQKSHSHIYFSQLYGMSDHISYNLAQEGYNVSKYLPYGPIKSTIPYLIRRAQENSAIAGQLGKELKFILLEKKRRQKATNR
jgi:proline dehydrogenase